MVIRPKVSRTPGPLTITGSDLVDYDGPIWRIARTVGEYARPWNAGRDFGPLLVMRWDPHLLPASIQPERTVLYSGTELLPAVAETWQATHHIDVHFGNPIIVRATPTRTLRLLDLAANSTWAIRHGASASLAHSHRDVCRNWARAILTAVPKLDGLLAPSTLSGTNVVLFASGIGALPETGDMTQQADDPAVFAILESIATRIGYTI